ncbi:MAG TPA: ABC transporter permease [Stellaceae bacterium]|jgi:putative ABC transport system permease protein
MARGRRDRWLLLRLAAQNVGRRRLRALFLGAAVMLGVGVGFAGFVIGWALSAGVAASLARMGADILVVPEGTLVNLTAGLLTVQPTAATLPADLAPRLTAIPGVARVARQRIVPVLVDGHPADLVAFDPVQDFSVLPWLAAHRPGPLATDGAIAGSALAAEPGKPVTICGKPLTVYGRLGKTGVGPFDQSWFVSFEALGEIVSFCRAQGQPQPHAAAGCAGDLRLDRVSAFLIQLAPGAKPAAVEFALGRLSGIRSVEGNMVLTASRQVLGSLLLGIVAFTLFQLAALSIVVALLFSAIVQERRREIGLLRAMGAGPRQVTFVILAEAAMITGLGGFAGLVFGAALMLGFARSLGFYFSLLGVPFAWPPLWVLEAGALAALLLAALLGLGGAVVPALRVRRSPPHALIRREAR